MALRLSRVWNKHSTAKRVQLDGYTFQSKAECERYKQLKLMVAALEICELEVHPRYPITINGIKICDVVLDFAYLKIRNGYDCAACQKGKCDDCIGDGALCACDHKPRHIYEDVKRETWRRGKKTYTSNTGSSKVGQRLLLAVYGIKVDIIFA